MRVKRQISLATAVALGALALTAAGCARSQESAAVSSSDVAWERNLDAALSRAGNESKVVMVDFYTDWCGWCRRLDETTYADVDVRRALSGVVAVKLNAEKEGRREAVRYRVAGYPTILFLSADGEEVGRIGGYLPPRPFLEELNDILNRV